MAAKEAGADRIELCAALQTGGLTPDQGLINLVSENLDIPIHVLIRPRIGNFVYDRSEFKHILKSIEVCRNQGVAGVVVGCLSREGKVDREQIKAIVDQATGFDLTFHRAIDTCVEIEDALDFLMELEFDRVLSSGAAPTAEQGMHLLKKMVAHTTDNKLSIMPGAGVNAHNVVKIIRNTGCQEIHGSGKMNVALESNDTIGLTSLFGQPIDHKWESNSEEIQRIKTALLQIRSN
ncbi:UNVERIFIED_CONTAM: hypothetical protein GTU68_063029 [Idotea baltica]|nr:hypothetical protein [Idotea baltica]